MEEITELSPQSPREREHADNISVSEVLRSPDSRILINDALFSEYDIEFSPERATLVAQPELMQFRGNSGHDVQAYYLEVLSAGGTEKQKRIAAVIKSHNTSQKAEQEYKNVLKVKKKGIATPVPILHVSNGDLSYVLFEYDPNLRSADTINWDIFTGKEKEEELGKFFQKYASELAKLHKLGIYHHDAQPRNVSYNRNTSELTFFDFEAAHVVDDNKHKKPEVHVSHASKELQKVLWGFCREGIVSTDNGREGALEDFNRVFLSQYFSSLSAYDSRFSDMQNAVVVLLNRDFRLPG
ncbi:MAG TPA: hypothetical protein PLD54_03110 [Candidatus Levybacteria bacterium]|nr:hypothetical protein [Candidatus Levybacteria bacterium]